MTTSLICANICLTKSPSITWTSRPYWRCKAPRPFKPSHGLLRALTILYSCRRDLSAGVTMICGSADQDTLRSEEHTSELQSLMRISYAVFCLTKNNQINTQIHNMRHTQDNVIQKI